jgi:two-component system CheB/CheR fusion protein
VAETPQRQQKEELIGLFLQQNKDHALILLDAQGLVVAWFPGAERVFGYASAEMTGQPVTHLFTPEDLGRGLAAHELEVARRDGAAEDDRWMLRKDGSRFWANGVLLALRDGSGRVVGFAKSLRDRTDVRAQIETLENRVAALQKADERKTLLLGTVAHELRNPLAPLGNAVKLLQLARPNDPDLAYPVNLIERQVAFLKRMVDDMLDVARVGAGKVELKKERLLLGEVLAQVVEGWRPRAEERRQRLELILPGGALPVEADPDRLRQVFTNLINNAVKYTPEGGRVWVKATAEGSQAVVGVEDNGVGIAPEMLPKIFELFTQEEESRYRSEGGLGIGLSLVKSLVTLHGGSVQVRSEGRGKGSEFTVRLPLAADPPPPTPSPEPGGQPA